MDPQRSTTKDVAAVSLPAQARIDAVLATEPHRLLHRAGTSIVLLGTAHVSAASARAVRELLDTGAFDAVAIELCESRSRALQDPEALARLNLFEVIRSGRTPMVAASLALGAYQTRLAEQYGIEPGAEMRAAIDGAHEHGVPLVLIDRDIGITLRRAYRSVPWWQRMGLITGLFGSVLSRDTIAEDELERLKEGDMLEATFNEFAEGSQPLYAALIHERDLYMAAHLQRLADADPAPKRVLAVVGAGHLAGIAERFAAQGGSTHSPEPIATPDPAASGVSDTGHVGGAMGGHASPASAAEMAANPALESESVLASDLAPGSSRESSRRSAAAAAGAEAPDATLQRLEAVPRPARWPKVVPWVIVAVILAGFAVGFSRNPGLGWQLVLDWVLINGGLAAVGALIAGAHPLTVIAAAFAAPLTSLNPTIGVGFVAAAVEIWLRKPEVGDFARLRRDTTQWRGWWRNRVSRVFLVFLLTTFGSALGTYIGGAWIFGRLFSAG